MKKRGIKNTKESRACKMRKSTEKVDNDNSETA